MAPSLEEVTSPLPVKALTGKLNGTKVVSSLQLEDADKQDKVLKVFRAYIADLCEQFKGGHPG